MNEWIKKQTESIKGFWSKWTIVQKAIFGGIILAAIIALYEFKHGGLEDYDISSSTAALFDD